MRRLTIFSLLLCLLDAAAAPSATAQSRPLPPGARDPVPAAPPSPLTPVPAPPPVRGRATWVGALTGGGLLGAAGLATGVLFCVSEQPGADDNICQTTGSKITVPGTLLLAGTLVGGLVGAAIGAAIPVTRTASAERALSPAARADASRPVVSGAATASAGVVRGEIGFFSAQAGLNRVLGAARAEPAAAAVRVAFLARLGRYVAVGPEAAYFPQKRERLVGYSQPGPPDELQVLTFGLAVRLGVPWGAFFPYATGAAGFYEGYAEGLVPSAGLGLDHRWTEEVSLGTELRLHAKGSGLRNNTPFVSATAGAAWHW